MHDMRLTSEEKKDFSTPKSSAPKYPYGLTITLGPEELEKLGLKEAPAVDTELSFKVKTFVKEVGRDELEGDESEYRVQLQITEMAEVKKDKTVADAMYGV